MPSHVESDSCNCSGVEIFSHKETSLVFVFCCEEKNFIDTKKNVSRQLVAV